MSELEEQPEAITGSGHMLTSVSGPDVCVSASVVCNGGHGDDSGHGDVGPAGSPAQSDIPPCKSSSGLPSVNGRVQYNVSPQWASNAIQLTGTSVEISLERLRNLYQDSLDPDTWDNKNPTAQELSQMISIALTPNFSGKRKYS